jgi:hypothetical protein
MRNQKIAVLCLIITVAVAPALPKEPTTVGDNGPSVPGSGSTPKPAESPDKKYWKHAFGPQAAGRAALGAGINQATNTPAEWGQGAEGFGKRFASSFGKHLVQKGIQYPVAKMFHEELSYHPSGKQGFGPRLKYALVGVVITHKTTTGKPTVAKGEIAGVVGSGLISRLWQPASVRTIGAGFTSAGITFGVDAAGNVVREFWPEIRHPHSHNKGATPSAGAAVTEENEE